MPEPPSIYDSSSLYARVFPVGEEDIAFFSTLLAGAGLPEGVILDLGSGTGALAAGLEKRLGRPVVAIDLEPALLHSPHRPAVSIRADLCNPPIRPDAAAATVCRLFGVAYAVGAQWQGPSPGALLRPLGALLGLPAPGGLCAWELPMAHHPPRLQGIGESATLEEGLVYTFRYLDVLARTPLGAVLDTVITVEGLAELHAPLHVFDPAPLARWLDRAGCRVMGFCPYGDSEELVALPPQDCLRGVVLFQRRRIASSH